MSFETEVLADNPLWYHDGLETSGSTAINKATKYTPTDWDAPIGAAIVKGIVDADYPGGLNFEFPGGANSEIIIPNSPTSFTGILNGLSAVSFEIVLERHAASSGIYFVSTDGGNSLTGHYQNGPHIITFVLSTDGGGYQELSVSLPVDKQFVLGSRRHVVLRYSDAVGFMQIIVDNVQQGSLAQSGLVSASNNFIIGSAGGNAYAMYSGPQAVYDDLYLTDGRINSHFNALPGGAPTNTQPTTSATNPAFVGATTRNPTVRAQWTFNDPDSSPNGDYLEAEVKWYVNGGLVATDTIAAPATLQDKSLSAEKGDTIHYTVRVRDNSGDAGTEWSAVSSTVASPVTVTNTTPTATIVSLLPAAPQATDAMTATTTRADADPADTPGLIYEWYLDAVSVQGPTLKNTGTAADLTDTLDLGVEGATPGQVVTCEVTPDDGTAQGTMQSSSRTVQSPPPPPAEGTSPMAAHSAIGNTMSRNFRQSVI